MNTNTLREDLLTVLESTHKQKLQRLHAYCGFIEDGIAVGRVIYLEIPNENIEGLYTVARLDFDNYSIALEPWQEGNRYIGDLVELRLAHQPDMTWYFPKVKKLQV